MFQILDPRTGKCRYLERVNLKVTGKPTATALGVWHIQKPGRGWVGRHFKSIVGLRLTKQLILFGGNESQEAASQQRAGAEKGAEQLKLEK